MNEMIFETLATEDAATQERVAGTRAVIAAQTRAKDSFGTFVANAKTDDERNARIELVASDLDVILAAVADEYGYEDIGRLRNAATIALGGPHPDDCTCGFCENMGKLPNQKDDDEDTKKSSKKDKAIADEAREEGESYEHELREKENGEGDDDDDDDDDCYDMDKKSSSVQIRQGSASAPDFDWDLDFVASVHVADGFSFCECNCEGCNSGNHCESEQCISTKHSGNPGNPASAKSSEKDVESKTAADASDIAQDSFSQERIDLPSSKDGLSDVGSPKIDKAKSGDNLGWDLKPIDVPSKQHPTEKQQIHETPDYKADLPGVSETGKSINADAPLAPEFYAGDKTETWSGTKGQAEPVTSSVLSKWTVA